VKKQAVFISSLNQDTKQSQEMSNTLYIVEQQTRAIQEDDTRDGKFFSPTNSPLDNGTFPCNLTGLQEEREE